MKQTVLGLLMFVFIVILAGCGSDRGPKATQDQLQEMTVGAADGVCPVMKDRVNQPEYSTTYQGRTIYFCCEDCIGMFNANPEKYMAKLR